ncbi:MAG: cation-transporting P-type ATPase [Gemmatimonadaceae bacterium]
MAELTTPRTYWSEPASTLVAALASSMQGLSTDDAARRRQVVGPNTLREERSQGVLGLLANQVKSPLVLVLVFAAAVSTMVGEYTDAGIVLAVVLGSALLGFAQEYRANGAVARLKSQIAVQCRVWRDGEVRRVPAADVVPGDVVQLSAGSLIFKPTVWSWFRRSVRQPGRAHWRKLSLLRRCLARRRVTRRWLSAPTACLQARVCAAARRRFSS